MPKIQTLDPHVADLIAAGEVVERPASVVKELMENAIDAGADSITVELRGGGMALIRVTDNGCGIAPGDAETAFLRHATSKLRDEKGLEAIGTLGFRGEALAAIAAVSRVELVTRVRGAGEGVRVSLESGAVTENVPAGCPEGTDISVRDLFFNTPARLKFMKNDRSEGTAATAAAEHIALSHPEISVRCIREGKEEFHTPGDGRTDSCVYSLLGREAVQSFLPAESNDGEIEVKGYVCRPAGCAGNRTKQFFFVNGRYIKSKLLQAAVEQAYRNALLPGRYPVCVLYMTLSPAAVDVNVHPAKTEVRFVREKQAFDAVYYAAVAALEAEKGNAAVSLPTPPKKVFSPPPQEEPKQLRMEPTSSPAFRTVSLGGGKKEGGGTYRPPVKPSYESLLPRLGQMETKHLELHDDTAPVYRTRSDMPSPSRPVPPRPVPEKTPEEKRPAPAPVSAPTTDFRVVGEAMNTYIVVEKGDSLLLIDKHAAHERILFDRLRAGRGDDAPQLLLVPEVVNVGAEDAELLEENAGLLDNYGFDISRFGEDSVAMRQVPSYLEKEGATDVILDLCNVLRRGGSPEDIRDTLLHSLACKAAIKAGRSSDIRELTALAARVVSGEVKYCPHGRPVAMEITKSMLDKSFRRI